MLSRLNFFLLKRSIHNNHWSWWFRVAGRQLVSPVTKIHGLVKYKNVEHSRIFSCREWQCQVTPFCYAANIRDITIWGICCTEFSLDVHISNYSVNSFSGYINTYTKHHIFNLLNLNIFVLNTKSSSVPLQWPLQ